METFIIRKQPDQDGQAITGLLLALQKQFPAVQVERAIVVETDQPEIADLVRLIGGKALEEAEPVGPWARAAAVEKIETAAVTTTTVAEPKKKGRRQAKIGTCSQCGGLNRSLMTEAKICRVCYQKNYNQKKKKGAEPGDNHHTGAGVDVVLEQDPTGQRYLTRHGPIKGKKLG